MTACAHCDGRGRVYAFDRGLDGHGGMNGGGYGYFQCGECDGTGDADAPARRRAQWPETWTLTVCSTCGTPKPKGGYTTCVGDYCNTQGPGEKITVELVNANPSGRSGAESF